MDVTIITTVVIGLLGIGALIFGLTTWLFKRFFGSFEVDLKEIKTDVKIIHADMAAMRIQMASEYVTRWEMKDSLDATKRDFLNIVRLIAQGKTPDTM